MRSTGFDARRLLKETFIEHQNVASATVPAIAEAFESLADLCTKALSSGCKILLFGNGGSAADAQHIAAELVVRFSRHRKAFAAIALTTDTSILTAAGNDLGFKQIFARQIAALARPGDVAIGISTSGRSPNVLAALAEARAMGCGAVGLTGDYCSELREVSDQIISIPSADTARIQEMHILIGHALCSVLEQRLGMEAQVSVVPHP